MISALKIKAPVFRLSAVSMCIMLLAGTAFLFERYYRLSGRQESFAYAFEIGRMLVNFGGMAILSPLIYQTIKWSFRLPRNRILIWLAGLLLFGFLYLILNKSVLFLISERAQSFNLWAGNRKLLLNFSHILVLFYLAASYGSYQLLKGQFPRAPKASTKANSSPDTAMVTVIAGLEADSIEYISAYDHYLKLHRDGSFKLIRLSLTQLRTQLPSEFIQIHRSHIVNADFVQKLVRKQGRYLLLMQNGTLLKVSASYQKKVLSKFPSGHLTT